VRVLGVDPGTRNLGWGVVDVKGTVLTHVAHGVVRADEALPLAARLLVLDDGFRAVLAEQRPDEVAVESLFFGKDASAAAKLGHARGVILLAIGRAGLAVHEYAPAMVKRALGGSGQSDKAQVALMVRAVLRLTSAPKADAADALAIAVTHVQAAPARRLEELHRAALAAAESRARVARRRG
jgi:crossover junction endodeoxyribonuclease RuvC